jgi:hypothetical protein
MLPLLLLLLSDSECSRKPPMPIASVVRGKPEIKRMTGKYHES